MATKVTSYPKEKIKILLFENVHKSAVEAFRNAGYTDIEHHTRSLDKKEMEAAVKGVHVIGIRSKSQISAEALAKADKLLTIGAFCIGTNQIDMNESTQLGIAVFNSPFSNTRSVAELVIGEIILLLRKVFDKDKALHQGKWKKSSSGSYETRGKTLGVVGYGHIGSQIGVLAEAIGMHVIYHDVMPKLPLGNAKLYRRLDELLSISDVVTLHIPNVPSAKNMFDKKKIAQMKKGAVLINCARADLIVDEDVKDALLNGQLGGFACDVFRGEPASNDSTYNTVFQNLPNVFLTPHIGGSTVEAQENIGVDVAEKLINYLDTGSTVGSLTVPDLHLPVMQNTHRLLHIHRNVPGLLSELNGVFSELKVNIVGQYLKTNAQIGYAVTDIEKTTPKVLEAVKQVKYTLRVRSLY